MQNKIKKRLWASVLAILIAPIFAETEVTQLKNVTTTMPQIQLEQPYVALVLVVDDSDAVERKRSFVEALKMVLVKESGGSDLISQPTIQEALSKSDRYVKQYSYVNRSLEGGKRVLFLRINFDRKAISKLLQRISKVVWVNNKPIVLLWLANSGKILTNETVGSDLADLLREKSRDLGIKVILPILDLKDIKQVKAQNVCNFDISVIKDVSNRYGVSVIAMGCVKPVMLGKIWSSQWLLLQDDKTEQFNFVGGSIKSVITDALQAIANNIFNVVTPVAAEDARVVLRIVNISGLDQYNDVVKYLRTFNDIKQVGLFKMNATNVELEVNIAGGKKALSSILNGQNKLILNTDVSALSSGIDLDYIWVDVNNEKS